MSSQGRGDRGSTSSSGRGSSLGRRRSSRNFVVERSQPIRGIISGVGVRERERDSQRNAGKQSPVPRNPDHREDSKISTHTRTLSRAESEEIFAKACESIEALLEIPENRKYICKNFSYLEHHLLDCIKWILGATWKESGIKLTGRLIGIFFNSMGKHSTIVCNWLTDSIFSSAECKKSSLIFVIRDVILIAITHMVPHQVSILMKSIHEQIEGISDPTVFRLFSTIFSKGILRNQHHTEFEMFSDFTDVVIGWMTDGYEVELGDTYFHLYAIIQELEPYFTRELGFLRDLITSIVDYIKEAATEEPVNDIRILRLLKTLEALLALRAQLDKKFLKSTLEFLVETMNGVISADTDSEKERRRRREFIQFTNECLTLVPGIEGKGVQTFIKTQLNLFRTEESNFTCWNSEVVLGFFAMLNCWVETVGTQSQLSVEVQGLCGEVMSLLDQAQPYFPQQDQLAILRVAQSLLRTRNLVLLQNVYKWVLGKLQREKVESKFIIKADEEAQLIVLATLTDIATNKSGSILSLWALDPSLIDLLMSMSQGSSYDSVRHSALKMLKSHCIAHSHFASNITSSKIFEAETPALRFLNSLLNFWTNSLEQQNLPWIFWLFDWISLFFKSTVPYAPILVERHLHFYTKVLHQLSNRGKLRMKCGLLVEWMAQDPNYSQSSQLLEVIREICLKILLVPNEGEGAVQSKYSEILKLLPNLIILPEELPERALEAEWNENGEGEEPLPILANPELNSFLKDLLVMGKDPSGSSDRVPSKSEIKAAVDYVIRLKLKTSLGRAPEFFSQLQLMARKILRRGVRESYFWKLDFVYQLQRKIHLCIYESAFLPSDIPEGIRSFYVTNKLPLTGWLKRMAPECIEVSFALKRYAMAYYFAVSIGEDQKAKLALLQLEDAEGLRGMNELGVYFYLNSEYEKAEHLAGASLAQGPDPVADIILAGTKLIFAGSAAKLESWALPSPAPLTPPPDLNGLSQIIPKKPPFAAIFPPPPPWNSHLIKLPVESCRTVLSLQLGHMGTSPGTDVIGSLESFSKLKLYEMVQVEDLILHSKKFTIDEKRRIQNCKLQKMIECGNVKSLRNWITTSGWLKTDTVDMNLERQVDTYKILGDLLFREGDFFESGTLYSCILELIDKKDGNEYIEHPTSPIPIDFKATFYLAFAEKVKSSTPFYERAVTKSVLLTALEGRHQAQQLFFDRARESSRTSSTQVRADAWFDYATFAYERSEAANLTPILKEVLKSNALHSYANYIKWNQKKSSHEGRRGKIIMAMIRLIKLYHQNHKFIPEDLVTSNLWLTILPELTKIQELRPYIMSKFPWAANFLIASLEYVRGKKQFTRRRGLFDPTTFVFTEASEEPFDSSDQTKICALEPQCAGRTVEKVLEEYWRGGVPRQVMAAGSKDNAPLAPQLRNYLTLVEEIERIGTTKEELWAEVIQRATSDWVKRITTLRKDMARDRDREIRNSEKVRVYIRPVVTYLKETWRLTMEGDTPADVAFICKYCDKIGDVLNDLEKCTTLDKLSQIYDTLQYYASVFESSASSKLGIVNVSPVLAQYDFGNPDCAVTLPGMEDGVTVASIHNTITCLHTKTNPKRIGLRGSNGKLYEYLIKGNENLHIDAGIMQLLRVTDEFSGCPTRHYSITPIGGRGGLIQIVPNAVPLFAMYKKYLQRNNATERPSEMFWRRLESLGFKDRSDVEGLKEVYNSLKEETPPDLISRDLLMCAENTMDWYKAVKTYTRDTAMGSAMGYTLELADRHLDNILINLREGHLVHVDFSILFGKGAFLKVPERVPFRLTQNIVSALQYPGINGAFAVYLDKFLQKFYEEKEMTLFCIKNIAMDSQLEEGVQICPEIILKAELTSTLDLIRLRVKNIWRIMELVIAEIQECSVQAKGTSNSVWVINSPRNATERLRKKINRWRRLLANVDPLITFVVTHTRPTGPLAGFHALVFNKWIPYVMHFWSHTDLEVVIQSSSLFEDRFKVCEEILQDFLREIPTENIQIEICAGPIVTSGEERVDKGKFDAIMSSADSRISAFIPSETANALISEATAEDNLAQMYEGWIPWV